MTESMIVAVTTTTKVTIRDEMTTTDEKPREWLPTEASGALLALMEARKGGWKSFGEISSKFLV
jgi:hypothetical protein